MAEQILEQIQDVVDGQIDFDGQEFAETLAYAIFIFTAIVSFTTGYLFQDITLALYLGLGGSALTFVAVVPPWPMFKQAPVKWLPAGYAAELAASKKR